MADKVKAKAKAEEVEEFEDDSDLDEEFEGTEEIDEDLEDEEDEDDEEEEDDDDEEGEEKATPKAEEKRRPGRPRKSPVPATPVEKTSDATPQRVGEAIPVKLLRKLMSDAGTGMMLVRKSDIIKTGTDWVFVRVNR